MSHSRVMASIMNDDFDDFDMIEYVKLKREEREEIFCLHTSRRETTAKSLLSERESTFWYKCAYKCSILQYTVIIRSLEENLATIKFENLNFQIFEFYNYETVLIGG
jgi:hypothetical protein